MSVQGFDSATRISAGSALTAEEIAAHLVLGRATVKTHVSNILMKLAGRDRVQAVVWAHRHGLAG